MRPAADLVHDLQPLRADPGHERFLNVDAGAVPHREQRFRFGCIHRDRLLAEHVLASFGGPNRPRDVKMIGQRVVDRLDVGIGEQFFVRSVQLRYSQRRRRGRSFFRVSRCDRRHVTPFPRLHRRHDLLDRDTSSSEHTPTHFFHAHIIDPAWGGTELPSETFVNSRRLSERPEKPHSAGRGRNLTCSTIGVETGASLMRTGSTVQVRTAWMPA